MPTRYSAEIVRSDGGRTILYVDGWTRKLEMYPKTGRPSIVISRPDKGVIWSLTPDTKTYSQTKLPPELEHAFNPDTLCDWTEDGAEMIDGRKFRRFIGRYREASGPIGEAHEVCFVDAKNGMRRRMVTFNVNGERVLTIDCLNAKVGPPPREVFEMPEGYKRGYHRRTRR
jgi:hypothetical protein